MLKFKQYLLLLFIYIVNSSTFACSLDSLLLYSKLPKVEKPTHFTTPIVISGSLIGYGLGSLEVPALKRLDIQAKEIANSVYTGRTYVDDFIQYTPSLAVFALELTGLKAKHSISQRMKAMATAATITAITTQALKKTTHIWRPDHSNDKSFPSGHTATAFVGAHMLFKEYKDQNIWIASSGYLVAASTGIFRMLNNKHWLSDVLAGAGIGILSTELAYSITPKLKKMFYSEGKRNQKMIWTDLTGDYPMLRASIYF